MRVMTECGEEVAGRLSELGVGDVRAGSLLLSQRYVERSKTKLVAFKSHALDLMETACAPAPQEEEASQAEAGGRPAAVRRGRRRR